MEEFGRGPLACWFTLAREQKNFVSRATLTAMADGVIFALEDRPTLNLNTWRPVRPCCFWRLMHPAHAWIPR